MHFRAVKIILASFMLIAFAVPFMHQVPAKSYLYQKSSPASLSTENGAAMNTTQWLYATEPGTGRDAHLLNPSEQLAATHVTGRLSPSSSAYKPISKP